MKYLLYYSIFSTILFFCQVAYSTEDNKDWDSLLKTIDIYQNINTEVESKKHENNKTQVKKPNNIPLKSTPQEISDYNRRKQKYLRDSQNEKTENLFKEFEKNNLQQPNRQPNFKFGYSNINPKGYIEKPENFNWGGKQLKYQYKDFEFVFESTNMDHVERMSKTISALSISGWEIDLNRSFQKISGDGDKAIAYTTTQMRFRKIK